MKVNSKILGIIVLVVIFGGIAASAALGYWNTEGKGDSQGAGSGEVAGEGSVIRGKTTFEELLKMGLSQHTIENVIGNPMPDPPIRVKSFCDEMGYDFESIKEKLEIEVLMLND